MKKVLFVSALMLLCWDCGVLRACTALSHNQNGRTLVGRNFDWMETGGKVTFVPRSKDTHGIFYLSQSHRSVDVIFEGMNDRGLCIVDNQVPVANAATRSGIDSHDIMRIVLEKSASVVEAVSVFKRSEILFRADRDHDIHYLIVDEAGRSAVIEYVDNKLQIVLKDGGFQVITNFYATNPDMEFMDAHAIKNGYNRYIIAASALSKIDTISEDAIFKILRQASIPNDNSGFRTIWSNVYDLQAKEILLTYGMNYHNVVRLDLEKEIKAGKHSFTMEELFSQ